MSEEIDPSPPSTQAERNRWFEWYVSKLKTDSITRPPRKGQKFRCPCCHFRTLSDRGGFDICPVCFWEDDGQDDHDADIVRGGPNGGLSLIDARENYLIFGACKEHCVQYVRAATKDEL